MVSLSFWPEVVRVDFFDVVERRLLMELIGGRATGPGFVEAGVEPSWAATCDSGLLH